MNESLVAACQLFLVPSSILFAALGVAKTDQLKTMISVMGFATCLLWIVRLHILLSTQSGVTPAVPYIDIYFGLALAYIFALAYMVSIIAHALLWRLSHKGPPAVSST